MNNTAISTIDFTTAFYNAIYEQHQNPEAHRGITTGLAEIEHALGGFKLGWYIIVGGAEKSGKTALMLSIFEQFLMGKRNGMWVSQEMSDQEMGERAYACLAAPDSGLDMNLFRDIRLTNQHWSEMDRIKALFATLPGWWVFGVPLIEDVLTLADEKDIEILVLDYLQLFSSREMKRQAGTVAEFSHISKLIKQWTLKKKSSDGRTVPRMVLAGSQLNRDANKSGTYNSANYYKNTSSIEQDANVAFVIAPIHDQAGNEEPHRKKLYIVASRHSEKAVFELKFEGANSRFTDAPPTIDINAVASRYLDAPAKPRRQAQQKVIDEMIPF